MNKNITVNKYFLISLFFVLSVSCFSQTKDYKELKKVDWIFSEKDFEIVINEERIPKESKKQIEVERPKDKAYELIYTPPADKTLEERHSSTIVRLASTNREKTLFRKAEALYANENLNKESFAKLISDQENPYWVDTSFDGVKIPKFITTSAIQYYQRLSQAFRDNKKVTNIQMLETGLKYTAMISHHQSYIINNEQFNDVDVVNLELGWHQYCSPLCAMGFVRNKIVIFNNSGEPIALFINKSLLYVVS